MAESSIVEVFMGEAKELLENLESDIVSLEENVDDTEIINRIFRYFHTLKGSSGIAGLTSIYEFSHKLENLLDSVRSGQVKVDKKLIDLVFASIDWIKDEIFSEDHDAEKSGKEVEKLLEQISILNKAVSKTESSAEGEDDEEETDEALLRTYDGYKYFRIKTVFREDVFESGIDPLMIIEDCVNTGILVTKNVNRKNLPSINDIDPEKCYLSWDLIIKTQGTLKDINDVFIFVADDNDISIEDVTAQFISKDGKYLQDKKLGEIMLDKGILTEEELEDAIDIQESERSKIGDIILKKGYASENDIREALDEQDRLKKKIEVSTVRVDTGKLDNLLNLLGEIVIGQSGLAQIADELEDDNETGFLLKNALYGLDRITREFQEQIMSIRMIPIGPSFEQFKRFVRDSASSTGKDIKLKIEGGDTELDKTVIEKISDPLKHMIRNSIDHGIELSDERSKAGKNPAGQINLRAFHQEGNVFIEIVDDGRGIDLTAIRKKAEELGLIKEDDEISRDRLFSFLFHPGFSTAKEVGDLSGRGVGMDVVKTNIEELRGSIEIKSEKGKGTTIRIKLPLTLAIIDGMMVRIGRNIYIIPLLSIIESTQPKQEDIRTIEGKGEVVHFRGEYISLIRLYESFDVQTECTNPWESLVIVVESGATRVGIMVDDLLGQQQIVIKSLDSYITRSRAVSGAAIMGDGKVALILDIHGLIEDLHN